MSVDTETTPAVESAPAPQRLPDQLAEFAAILAFENIVKDMCALRRGQLYDRLAETREDTGSKSFQARDAENNVMADFTLKDSTAAYKVSDSKAFTQWVIENFPKEVEMEPSVKPAFTKALLSTKRLTVDGDEVIDTTTGMVVDGVKFYPSVPATSFGTSWKDGGKEAAAAALLEGTAERLFATHIAAAVAELEAGQS